MWVSPMGDRKDGSDPFGDGTVVIEDEVDLQKRLEEAKEKLENTKQALNR